MSLRSLREACAAVGLFVVVALFRYLSLSGFSNDHYVHLAGAQQMLFGEWPTRDFVDLGAPLTYALSAMPQGLFGQGLLTEAVLTAVLFAIAAVLTLRAVVLLTGSVALGLAAAAVEVLMFPRSYSDTKMLVYAAAALALVRYSARPGRDRLVVLALVTAIAFLTRHDHGLFVGIAAGVAALLAPMPSDRKRPAGTLLWLGAATLLIVLPYLIYLQATDGVLAHLERGATFSRLELPRQRVTLTGHPFPVAWLLYGMWIMPAAAFVAVLVQAWTRKQDAWPLVRRVVPIATLALVADFGLIRDALDARLADAVVAPAVLMAWLARQAWCPAPMAAAWTLRSASVVLIAITIGSAAAMGDTRNQLERTGFFQGIDGLSDQFGRRARELRRPFEGRQTPSRIAEALRPFFDYALRCVDPGDRLLAAGFLPEVPVLARRAFAGGQVWFTAGALATPQDHQLVMTRLARQRVPLVVLRRPDYDDLALEFPELDAYITGRFEQVAQWSLADDDDTLYLMANRSLVRGQDGPTGWPCFR
jgi:hypothetical protein